MPNDSEVWDTIYYCLENIHKTHEALLGIHGDCLKINNIETIYMLMNTLYSIYMLVNFYFFTLFSYSLGIPKNQIIRQRRVQLFQHYL